MNVKKIGLMKNYKYAENKLLKKLKNLNFQKHKNQIFVEDF